MCKRKQSIEKENSTLLEHKAYLGMGILLIYHSSLSLSKKRLYAYNTPRLSGLCGCLLLL